MNAPEIGISSLICARCHAALIESHDRCAGCGLRHVSEPGYFRYEFDELLFDRFRREYLLNKVLNNNGTLSYELLKEGSISLPERADVQRFRDFLLERARPGTLLDVGCGILETPGYLAFPPGAPFALVGLDPLDDRHFRGLRIVGCSEFMPFPNESVDTIVFATSLDHVCSLETTLSEAARVVRPAGKVIIWMGDQSQSLRQRLYSWIKTQLRSLKVGYRTDRYAVFPNGVVLFIPPGAVDPFHSHHENPRQIVRLMAARGFALEAQTARTKDEVFLAFAKAAAAAPRS